MAKRTRPLLMTGVALASTAAIVAATPTIAPSFTAASVPSPHALSTAQYELATLQVLLGLTPSDWQSAYFDGWGGGVTPDNEWFPFDGDSLSSAPGIPGVTYLALDALLNGTTPDVDTWTQDTPLNFYYELGTSAAVQVVLQKTIGANPLVSAAITALFYPTATINSLIYTATTFLPPVPIGPVLVGGGILTGLYYANGLPAILDYVTASIAGALPFAANTAVNSAAAKTLSVKAAEEPKTEVTQLKTESTGAAEELKTESTGPAEELKTESTGPAEELKTEVTGAAKAGNPLNKIGKKISDALSGKKISDALSGKKISDALSGKKISDALSGKKAKSESSSNDAGSPSSPDSSGSAS